MDVRDATVEDLAAMVAIYNQAIAQGLRTADTEPFTVKSRRSWFDEHEPARHPIFVAQENGAVVGYTTLSAYRAGRAALRGTAEISCYVDEKWHRRGVGSKLLAHAIAQARDRGFKTLLAIVIEANGGSRSLLERFGFATWGFLPRVLEHGGSEYAHVYLGLRIDGGGGVV